MRKKAMHMVELRRRMEGNEIRRGQIRTVALSKRPAQVAPHNL